MSATPEKIVAASKANVEAGLKSASAFVTTVFTAADGLKVKRLQSLSNKRNEAFETMTNFIKKMQDSRSSIIGNMR